MTLIGSFTSILFVWEKANSLFSCSIHSPPHFLLVKWIKEGLRSAIERFAVGMTLLIKKVPVFQRLVFLFFVPPVSFEVYQETTKRVYSYKFTINSRFITLVLRINKLNYDKLERKKLLIFYLQFTTIETLHNYEKYIIQWGIWKINVQGTTFENCLTKLSWAWLWYRQQYRKRSQRYPKKESN